MDSKTLFQELVKEGLIQEEVSKRLQAEAVVLNKNPEDILYDRHGADESKVAKVKSKLLGIPFKAVESDSITPDLAKLISEGTIRNYKVVPIQKSDNLLVVGMVHPDDAKAQEALKFIAKQQKLNLGVYLITPSDWQMILRKYSPYDNEVASAVQALNLGGRSSLPSQNIVRLEEEITASEEAPIIKLVASTLKEAVFQKASDIHIEPMRTSLRIRFRLDGDLHVVSTLPIELHQPVVSRVKVLSNLKLDETRVPQDGRFRTILGGKDIDYRVATFPTAVGEKVAIRVLDPSVGLKGLEGLGFLDRNLRIIKEGIDKPYGMILITGPTGSGKTTTLYSIMQILNKEDVNIVSLEDPVEYFIEGLNQSQVRPEINYDFASGLRQILRQDPDVILVGEIRDEETAGLAVHAALTGHIVLSTLHTNNSLGVIPRLVDMKVDSFLLPSALNLMLAQRLVSQLCDKCRKPEKAPQSLEDVIKGALSKLPPEVTNILKSKIANVDGPYEIYHAPGCSVCNGKGIIGRVALFEVFTMTKELAEVISSGPTEKKLNEEAKRQGMVTMRDDGIIKALLGTVSLEEVLKETSEAY